MKLIRIITILLPLIIGACKDDVSDADSVQVVINLSFGENQPTKLADFKVIAINEQYGQKYIQGTNNIGQAIFNVEAGIYTFSVQYSTSSNNIVDIYSGSITNKVITNTSSLSIDVLHSQSGQIIIKEIYYTGCKGADGKTYFHDQYLILYNNSLDTAYLDSLCIAYAYPSRATTKSPFSNLTKYPFVPAFNFAWMFQGNGHDIPLAPGHQVVVAPNCINHIAIGNENSIDLSHEGYWACYSNSAGLTKQSAPSTPDKLMLKLIWKDEGTSCISSILDPAFVIWKVQGDYEKFISSCLVANPEQPTSRKLYMAIPLEWIYDGVECLASSSGNKRLPAIIDNGGIINSQGSGSGTVVARVLDEEASNVAGFPIYKDTNNSTDDFYVTTPSLK